MMKANMPASFGHLNKQNSFTAMSDMGSTNQDRVAFLENKYGPYNMISNLFTYEEVQEKPDFMIIKFKDATYRG
jgi:hypothetical protein